jgi:hypothetical protein
MKNDLAGQLVAKGTELTPQSQQAEAATSQRGHAPRAPGPSPWIDGPRAHRWQPALVVPGPQASPRRQMDQGLQGPNRPGLLPADPARDPGVAWDRRRRGWSALPLISFSRAAFPEAGP